MATDKNTQTHVMQNGKTVLVDTVSYHGLVPGTEYIMSGKLYDKATGEPFVRSEEATEIQTLISSITGKSNEYLSEIRFTPETSDGTVEITFDIDTTDLGGRQLVVFEKLYAVYETGVVEITNHEDIQDEDQTVVIPKIGTTAIDKATKTKNTAYGDKITVTDTVAYENLIPGIEYTLRGTLMDKGDEKLTDYKAEMTFTPTEASGEVEMEFVIDTTALIGHTLVAYEYLSIAETDVAKHEDVDDTEQTVYVPEIKTTATVDNSHETKKSAKTTLIDKVEYTNLIVGQKYTLNGTLMDKKTGAALQIDGKSVTASVVFEPKVASGTVEVTFEFDSTKMENPDLVVFEDLYIDEVKVTTHSDINDTNQTVTFHDDRTDTDTVPTGLPIAIPITASGTLTLGGFAVFQLLRRKKIRLSMK